MKHVCSTSNGAAWQKYAERAAHYAAQLRALGLAHDDPERIRARRSVRLGITNAQHEARKCKAVRRIIRAVAVMKYKKALAAA